MKKRLLCIVMVIVTLLSITSIAASAATSKTVYAPVNQWSSTVKCTLSKNIFGKTKSGTVRATVLNWGVKIDVRMSNVSDFSKIIWSKNNAFKNSSKASKVAIDLSLGNNNSVYYLQFRSQPSASMQGLSVEVKSVKNVKVG